MKEKRTMHEPISGWTHALEDSGRRIHMYTKLPYSESEKKKQGNGGTKCSLHKQKHTVKAILLP